MIFIYFAKTTFKCPHCGTDYDDNDDKWLDRCNKNKSGCTRIKCNCGNSFYMTYNYMSEAVSFIPKKNIHN